MTNTTRSPATPGVDPAPVRLHTLRLRAAGMSAADIGRAANITKQAVHGLLARRQNWIQKNTAAALLAVPVPVADSPACRDDPERAYDDDRTAEAKAACLTCPVAAMCRDLAVQAREPWGVWGGLTVVERERLRAGSPVVTCAGCGLDCVPADGGLCSGCQPPEPGPKPYTAGYSSLLPHRDLVFSLSLDRWESPDIAALVGSTDTAVRRAQDLWGLPVTAGKRGPKTAPKPCGTPAATRRHYRRGERCDVCWPAAARGQRDTWSERRERQNQLRAERRRRPQKKEVAA